MSLNRRSSVICAFFKGHWEYFGTSSVRSLITAALLPVLTSCSLSLKLPESDAPPLYLLDTEQVFSADTELPEIEEVGILDVSPEMRAFVESGIRRASDELTVQNLLRHMTDAGYYDGTYERELTLTAKETFAQREGNCFAFTSLFIALARELGLNAQFQRVVDSSIYDARNGVLENQEHINVLIRPRKGGRLSVDELVVDFNFAAPKSNHTRAISDTQAHALYYNNFAVSHFLDGNNLMAWAYLVKAFEKDPLNSFIWVNLGTLFQNLDKFEEAEVANRFALQLNSRSVPAMSGLKMALESLGRFQDATALQPRIQRFRARNPFYHLALAQRDIAEEHYRGAIDHLNTAIDLSKNQRFYSLRARVYRTLGESELALADLVAAVALATSPGEMNQLQLQLDHLISESDNRDIAEH